MPIRHWIWITLAVGLFAIAPPLSAEQLPPMETIKQPVDAIVQILRDPAYQQPDQKPAQRTKIWETARPMFDFDEISRRTVGVKWEKFSADEKKRFTDVFSEFLGNTYIDKMQGEYHNEKIVYVNEIIREAQAMVRTKLLREAVEIPIDYRLKLRNGRWLIYDILVEEGVSLVKNYRDQFQTILQKETPAQLIQRLEKKLADQKAGTATPQNNS